MAILKPFAAIFDVDGTLCDVSGIRHYVRDPLKKNFRAFHAASAYVPAHEPVVNLAKQLHEAGVVIFVVTARRERWRYVTSNWLRKYEVPHDYLYMRDDWDDRRDVEVKRDILVSIRNHHNVILAVDDNPAVIQLWNDESIPVVTWPGWETE